MCQVSSSTVSVDYRAIAKTLSSVAVHGLEKIAPRTYSEESSFIILNI